MSEKISQLYNRVSESYNESQSQLILKTANSKAFEKVLLQKPQLDKILSLGIGDGAYLVPYAEQFKDANLFGLDISSKMLEKAQQRLDFTSYLGDISSASDIIDQVDFNLIMAHFVLAYVSLTIILEQVNKLIAPLGYLSIVTNLTSSFQRGIHILEKMKQSRNPINKILFKHLEVVLNELDMPDSVDDLCAAIEKAGFEIVETESLSLPIRLDTLDDLETFFVKGGWFVSGLVHDYIPANLLLYFVRKAIKQFLPLPYEDTAEIAVVLARKKNTDG